MVLLAACVLRDVMPGPPVMGAKERAAFVPARAAVAYTGPPLVDEPVVPVQVWGLRYALDVVLVSDHPDWVMHEYARVDTPDGPVWLAKDAGRDREQTIVADIPDIERWVPEVPVRRLSRPLEVEDRGSADRVDLSFRYTNPLDQAVEVHYEGRMPSRPSRPRNGNTMGHSARTVAAVLDLHLFRLGGKARIVIDGKERGLHRLLGLLPEKYVLAQTQGGFAVGEVHAGWTVDGDTVWRAGSLTTLRYTMPEGELTGATVEQAGVGEVLRLAIGGALPDMRRPFDGDVRVPFVLDVGGQIGHGRGWLSARWTDPETAEVDMIPTEPRWFADRPMRTTITYGAGTRIRIERRGTPAPLRSP